MSTINGLPAHPLLVHFVVVLAPLAAALVILCAVWPAARRRFVWLLFPTAAVVLVLTPVTTNAGESLDDKLGNPPLLDHHANLGNTMLWFAIALAVVAAAVTAVHYAEVKSTSLKPVLVYGVAALSIVVGVATVVQTYRIGDSGAHAVWGGQP
jgi:ABC-type branched-subunit amino acid transport system permease subunit